MAGTQAACLLRWNRNRDDTTEYTDKKSNHGVCKTAATDADGGKNGRKSKTAKITSGDSTISMVPGCTQWFYGNNIHECWYDHEKNDDDHRHVFCPERSARLLMVLVWSISKVPPWTHQKANAYWWPAPRKKQYPGASSKEFVETGMPNSNMLLSFNRKRKQTVDQPRNNTMAI